MSAEARSWTVLEMLRWTTEYLTARGFHNARLNAELLLAGTLGLKRLDVYLQYDRPLAADEIAEYRARLLRRARREPIQYIEGLASFRELVLNVDRRVLIPRPETELLVEEVLRWCEARGAVSTVDVGTGSGAIALSLAREGALQRVVATDVCEGALDVARSNAERAGLVGVVELRAGSVYEPVRGERFDVVVSNPPYIAHRERSGLDTEVVDWEPHRALFSGESGLEVVEQLIDGAPAVLRPGGLLALEIGWKQAPAVVARIEETGRFATPRVCQDYGGRDRMVLAEYVGDD